MKYIFVALVASLAVMVLTQAKPVVQQTSTTSSCMMPQICGKRADGSCQLFANKCEFDNTNCRVNNAISSKWTQVDISKCSNLSGTGTIGPCT